MYIFRRVKLQLQVYNPPHTHTQNNTSLMLKRGHELLGRNPCDGNYQTVCNRMNLRGDQRFLFFNKIN